MLFLHLWWFETIFWSIKNRNHLLVSSHSSGHFLGWPEENIPISKPPKKTNNYIIHVKFFPPSCGGSPHGNRDPTWSPDRWRGRHSHGTSCFIMAPNTKNAHWTWECLVAIAIHPFTTRCSSATEPAVIFSNSLARWPRGMMSFEGAFGSADPVTDLCLCGMVQVGVAIFLPPKNMRKWYKSI